MEMKARLLVCPNAGYDSHIGETTKAYCFTYPNCTFKHICYRCNALLIPTTTLEDFPDMLDIESSLEIKGIE